VNGINSYYSWGLFQISISKLQTPNKSQWSKFKIPKKLFRLFGIGAWNLFFIWSLEFGAYKDWQQSKL